MKRIISIIIIITLFAIPVYAYRISKPDKITKIDEASLAKLNIILENLWDLTNGRYTLNIVTSNPDGSAKGTIGDVVLFNNSGTFYLEINTDGSTQWRGVQLTDTP